MKSANALIAFIGDQQNIRVDSQSAPLEQFKIVNRAFAFMDANDFATLAIDQDLVLDGMAFMLTGIRFRLFF